MTDYPFEMQLVVDPDNPRNVVAAGSVSIYDSADTGRTTLLALKDPSGVPISNPITSNANGFTAPFVTTSPQVLWVSGDYTDYFNSYLGLRNEAVAAVAAAEAAASTAGAEAAAVATAAIGTATDEATAAASSAATAASNASASATAAANAAALVGAPADAAITAAINNGASATRGALNATYAAVSSPTGTDATGVIEATTIINAALTSNAGKTVFIPRGTYLVDTINVPAGTTLLLDDRATFKLKAGAARPAVLLNGAGATLRGGNMDGNGTNQTVIEGAPLVRITADDCTVESVSLINIKDYGIRSSGSRSRIRNNTVTGGGGNAIFVQPSSVSIVDPEISGNHVDRSDQGTGINEGGIKVHRSGALTVTGARIANNRVILPIGTTLAPPVCIEVFPDCDNATITGNVVTGGRIGISIAIAKGASVTGNTCTQNGDYGIEFSGAIRSTASGNTINGGGTGTVGFSCNSAATNCAITGNTFSGCAGSGIKIEGVSTNIAVTGNMVNATAVYGIEVINSTHITIAGNMLDGNATALKAVMLDRSFPATVTGNTARRFTQNAVLVSSTIAQTINMVTVVGNTFDSTNGALASQLSGGATLGTGIRATGNMPYTDILNLAGDVRQINGAGSPESAFAAGPGSLYLRTDVGSGMIYIKNSGTGTTGWKLVTQAA